MGSRKDIENYIITAVSAIDRTGKNAELYRELFKTLSKEDFEAYTQSLADGSAYVNLLVPPLSDIDKGISVENNLKVAKTMGIKMFHKLNFEDSNVSSNIRSLVGYGTFRRMRQTTVKGLSVHKHTKSRNALTNESSGKSKGVRITLPESDILLGHSLKETMKEILGPRGGDMGANAAMLSEINKTGAVKQSTIDNFATGTSSKNVIHSLFKAMHLDISL